MPAINPIAVVAAVVAAMVIGGIYYMPALMGTRMMMLSKVIEERAPSRAMMLQVAISLVAMLALAAIESAAGAKGAVAGAVVGFWVFLVVGAADAGRGNFSGTPWSLWLINLGNWAITFLVAGAIIGALS